MIESISIPPLG